MTPQMREQAPPAISSGGATVIASGTLIPFGERGEVSFTLGPLSERLTVAFRFEDGPITGPGTQIEVTRPSSEMIRLVLRDFGGPTGEGTIKPLRLGVLGGLHLYVHFRVFRVGQAPRTFHYTFYLRDERGLNDRIAEALTAGQPSDE